LRKKWSAGAKPKVNPGARKKTIGALTAEGSCQEGKSRERKKICDNMQTPANARAKKSAL